MIEKFSVIFIASFLLTAVCVIATTGCTDEEASGRALRAQGFDEIEYTGYSFFACSKDDTFHTGFRAKNSKGSVVEGAVCCGLLFKNCTIRYN